MPWKPPPPIDAEEAAIVAELTSYIDIDAANIELARLRAENARLRNLVQSLIDNDPADMAGDGITVLMEWRKQARAVLGIIT